MKRLVTYLLLSLFVIATNVEVADAISFPVHKETSVIGKKKRKEKKYKKGNTFLFAKKFVDKIKKGISDIETMSLLSFIFGILASFLVGTAFGNIGFFLSILGFVFGILAVIFGFIGLNKSSDSTSTIFAIIGIVTGGLVVLLFLIFILFIAAALASA